MTWVKQSVVISLLLGQPLAVKSVRVHNRIQEERDDSYLRIRSERFDLLHFVFGSKFRFNMGTQDLLALAEEDKSEATPPVRLLGADNLRMTLLWQLDQRDQKLDLEKLKLN